MSECDLEPVFRELDRVMCVLFKINVLDLPSSQLHTLTTIITTYKDLLFYAHSKYDSISESLRQVDNTLSNQGNFKSNKDFLVYLAIVIKKLHGRVSDVEIAEKITRFESCCVKFIGQLNQKVKHVFKGEETMLFYSLESFDHKMEHATDCAFDVFRENGEPTALKENMTTMSIKTTRLTEAIITYQQNYDKGYAKMISD